MPDRRLLPIAASLALTLALARPSGAQNPYDVLMPRAPMMDVAPNDLPPVGMRSPDTLILARPDVQAELRLNATQRSRIARLRGEGRERQAEIDDRADWTTQNFFSPVPAAAVAQLEQWQTELDEDLDSKIAGILTISQRARFAQIRLQLDGPMAFTRPAVIERLVLDDDQAATIRTILEEAREEMAENARLPIDTGVVPRRLPAPPPRAVGERLFEEALAESRAANQAAMDAAMGRIARVLRRHQWESYLKLRGRPFVQAAARRPSPARVASPPPARRRQVEAEPSDGS